MVGDVIHPLNQLAVIAPERYELQRSKYLVREAVLDARIAQDGLLFNDTVHCAPLHPNRLFAARERLGLNPPRADASRARQTGRFSGLFFEIPLDHIATQRLLWYRWETPWINGFPNEDVPLAPPLEEFEPFDASRYRELPDVTDAHAAYLRRMKETGRQPLLFVHIPHVLVAGPIDAHRLEVIQWDNPQRDRHSLVGDVVE